MEGMEYMGLDHRTFEEDALLLFAFGVISILFSTSTYLCVRRVKKEERPVLPTLDTMVHAVPTTDNPFLKLRVHTFSAAEECLTPKPVLHL